MGERHLSLASEPIRRIPQSLDRANDSRNADSIIADNMNELTAGELTFASILVVPPGDWLKEGD